MDVAERYARALNVDPVWLLRGDVGPTLSEHIAKDLMEAAQQIRALRGKPSPFAAALEEVEREIKSGKMQEASHLMAEAIHAAAREVVAIKSREEAAGAHASDVVLAAQASSASTLENAGALAVGVVPEGVTDVPGARPVRMAEVGAAAGDGAYNLDEAPVIGPLWFRRDWIDSQGIDPTQAAVISVRNESMEPTLTPGCKILIDRNRRRRRVGHIYVITTADGLIVKRMGKDEDGGWLLVSDNDSPDWPDLPWPSEATVIGEVKWMARELP